MIQSRSWQKDVFIILAKESACQNSEISIGPVLRSRHFFHFFPIVYVDKDAGAPSPGWKTVSVKEHGHLGGRRGQRQVFALNQEFSAHFAPNLSVLIHLVHLIFIWQCPSGTANGYNILQINSFSLHPVFQRTSGLRIKKSVEFWLISVSILWGQAPQKLLTNFLKFSEKILCPKNSKIIFSILGLKIMQIDLIWSQGYGKTVFLTKN